MAKLPLSIIPAGKRSKASREALRQRRIAYQTENQAKKCAVLGCDKHRLKVSSYCRGHYQRNRRYGHPTGRLPTQSELRSIEGAIKVWLEDDYLTTDFAKRSFKSTWGSAQRTITHNPAFALPFIRLEGDMGYTQKAKAWVILSNYVHREKNSLSDAMVRYMACRLWSEFLWQMPNGKGGAVKARNHFVNTWAGKFVLANSGFTKTTTEEKVIRWEKPWYVSDDAVQNRPRPITEQVTTKVTLNPFKAGPIVRAIGKELHDAVDHAMGKAWCSDHRLLEKAHEALGLSFKNSKKDVTE